MIDLHTHTFFSDGELVPSELVRRAEVIGYNAIAITDHVDESNLESVVTKISDVAEKLNKVQPVKVIAGVELTHTPPQTIADLTARAREMGAKLIVVHGETLVEPVKEGTNRAAIEAGVDIVAHPGLISPEEVSMAKERGVYLEITTRRGHSLSNGHVAKLAGEIGALLVVNTDTHSPGDLVTIEFAKSALKASGLSDDAVNCALKNSGNIVERVSR